MDLLLVTHHRRSKAFARAIPFASLLSRRGHRVTLIVTADRARWRIKVEEQDGWTLVEMPDLLPGRLRSGWDLWHAIRAAWFLKGLRPTIIHTFETRPNVILPVITARSDTPLVTDWVDWWGGATGVINEIRPPWYRKTFGLLEAWFEVAFRARAGWATTISHPLAERAIDLGVPRDHVTVIRDGTYPDDEPARTIAECRRQLGLAADAPILGFSSLDSHLDLEVVRDALHHVLRTRPTTCLIVTGRPSSRIVQMFEKAGLSNSVLFTGLVPLPEMFTYLGACDVLLMPLAPGKQYNVGRWPHKYCDYATVGRPVVTNAVGDVAEIVAARKAGLIARWNAEDFARQINVLLDDPDLAKRMGANARQIAETELRWEQQIDLLENFYERVLDTEADQEGPGR